jgi:hypothetical protein
MDFVASMGGISRVLLQLCGAFYGGYATFWSVFSTLGTLYKLRSECKIFKDVDEDQLQTIHLDLCTRIAVFYHQSCLAPLISCCKTKNHKKIMEIYKQVSVRVKQDMDIINILDKQRQNQHDIELIKKTLKIEQDPIFQTKDERGIHDFETTTPGSDDDQLKVQEQVAQKSERKRENNAINYDYY